MTSRGASRSIVDGTQRATGDASQALAKQLQLVHGGALRLQPVGFQPAQAPPSSPRMARECGPVAPGSASGRTAANSSAVVCSSGKASIGASVGCVAAAWRRCSVYALLEAKAAVFRVSVSSGGRRAVGADVLSARCPRLPLGVSSIGAGGWVERTSRPRGGAGPRGACSGRINTTTPVNH